MVAGVDSAWRLYDIRGTTDAVAEAANLIIKASPEGERQQVLVGYDGSIDAYRIAQETFGVEPVPLTSPALYRLSRGYSWAVQITASHDSAEGITGLKVAQDGYPWTAERYEAVRETGRFQQPPRSPVPGLEPSNEPYAYRRMLAGTFGGLYVTRQPINVWAGSAVAGEMMLAVLEEFGLDISLEVIPGLDPADHTCGILAVNTDKNGVIVDADGDRLGIIWKGRWYSPEAITRIDLIHLAATGNAGQQAVLMDIRTDAGTLATARALGFRVELGPGGRWMNLACSTPAYIYGAEPSGHRYWQAWNGTDCAIYGAVRTLVAFFNAAPNGPPELDTVGERRGYAGVPVLDPPEDWLHISLSDGYGQRWEAEGLGWICTRQASDGLFAINWQGAGAAYVPGPTALEDHDDGHRHEGGADAGDQDDAEADAPGPLDD